MIDRVGIFPSAAKAALTLADFGKTFVMPNQSMTADDISCEATSGGWVRALSRKCPEASSIYREWAVEAIPRIVKSARFVINQEQFDRLVHRMGMELLHTLRENSTERRARLPIGEAFRVVDRLFMSINESESCRSRLILGFLHVPLESATLAPIRLCVNELLDKDFAVEIPANVPSGYVATEEQYVLLQEAIFALAAKAGVPPIVYAYFCADSA